MIKKPGGLKFASNKIVLSAILAQSIFVSGQVIAKEEPKLVLMLTIDQLRGDQPNKYYDRFGEGGFKYLMDKGTVYNNAHFKHSTTFTAVGHATLATGGSALQHGLAGNDWENAKTGERIYCVEDPNHNIIGKKYKDNKGTSPLNLTSSTIGDELHLSSGQRSRVFSVSIKDRGAILPGGHLGKAFWYGSGSGKFVSSTYYYDEYPKWVSEYNGLKKADAYQSQSWDLLNPADSYTFAYQDGREMEKGYKHLKNTFPHKLGNEKAKNFYKALRFTPMGDALTVDFAKTLMEQEQLGRGEATDMLAVSLSATDYIGHAYGPNSLEAEDNMLRLDRTLADLFSHVDKKVGLENTLIFLSSDHGTDEIPEYRKAVAGDYHAGRHYPKKFISKVNEALQLRYGTSEKMVSSFWNPSIYLNLPAIKKLGLNLEEVERALAEEILKVDGVAFALTRTDLLKGNVTSNATVARVQNAFHPVRSGNVLIVQDQFWYLYPNADQFSAMHGSPYSYDTHVPIMFAGPGIKAQAVNRKVAPMDIAGTVSTYLGTAKPSGSIGDPLFEILK
jgi:predicted AlkP superfamily pyrophosphatase or phosphodiesterase